jgi:hypothetical protein
MKGLNVSLGLIVFALAGCTAATAAPSPTPTPTPTPTPSPAAEADFTVSVFPAEDPVEARVAIPGEKVSFLVVVESPGDDRTVAVTAVASGAKITTIKPAQLKPGVVGEVWLTPDSVTADATATVTVTASRGTVTRTVDRSIKVTPMTDERAADAQRYFQMWVDYLATAHPELGITKETVWEPTYVSIFLVVSHYAYYSDEWEMKVSWHNMIPPYDWTEVYLRHRGTEWKPSLDFKIDSVSGKTAAYATTPPDAVMR